ncbi:MAG TPA: DUF5695 domain-containing protein, partial [Longimicrobiales bacterium]|nr:DUF5695 domain-containing protein [Longimicrobiales bacterium]
MSRRRAVSRGPAPLLAAVLALAVPLGAAGLQNPRQRRNPADTVPTLGLEQGFLDLETPAFHLRLVQASQTVAALEPRVADGFDFTPGDLLEQRAADGYYHLGDLTLRLRTGTAGAWQSYSTAGARKPVRALEVSAPMLAAADLGPTLPADMPVDVRRYWEVDGGHLTLRFEFTNESAETVEIGGLGIPMIFDNILQGRSLDEAHAICSFHDPYIGGDAGYLQVTRLSGHGPALLVVPHG